MFDRLQAPIPCFILTQTISWSTTRMYNYIHTMKCVYPGSPGLKKYGLRTFRDIYNVYNYIYIYIIHIYYTQLRVANGHVWFVVHLPTSMARGTLLGPLAPRSVPWTSTEGPGSRCDEVPDGVAPTQTWCERWLTKTIGRYRYIYHKP